MVIGALCGPADRRFTSWSMKPHDRGGIDEAASSSTLGSGRIVFKLCTLDRTHIRHGIVALHKRLAATHQGCDNGLDDGKRRPFGLRPRSEGLGIMSTPWKTKYGLRRVRQEHPTLDEAIFA